MTNEERDIVARFVARVGGHAAQPGFGGSVPGAQAAPPLPPVDPEADQFIAGLFNQYPEARYRITQTAFVQEAALNEAKSRIERLQWELQQAQQQLALAQQQQQQPRSGILGGLFGGGQQQAAPQYTAPPPPPPPQYSQYAPQPGMFQQQGTGFFGSALRTAAGVAGGVVLAEAITGMFEGNRGYGGGFGGGGFGGGLGSGGFGGGGFGGGFAPQETIVNNYYEEPAQQAQPDPWGGAGTNFDTSSNDSWSSQPDNSGNDSSNDSGNNDSSNFDDGNQGGGDDSSGGDWGN